FRSHPTKRARTGGLVGPESDLDRRARKRLQRAAVDTVEAGAAVHRRQYRAAVPHGTEVDADGDHADLIGATPVEMDVGAVVRDLVRPERPRLLGADDDRELPRRAAAPVD